MSRGKSKTATCDHRDSHSVRGELRCHKCGARGVYLVNGFKWVACDPGEFPEPEPRTK